MLNSSDMPPSPYAEDYWIFSQTVLGILILISCYILICLGVYVWKNRKDRKGKYVRKLLLFNILAIVMALGRLISDELVAFLGWQTTNYCFYFISGSILFYSASTCPVYILLWMRQHKFYSNKQLSSKKNKKFVYLSKICLFLLVFGWIIITVVHLVPSITGWRYEATNEGCRDANDQQDFEIIPMLSNALGALGQIFLLSLLLYPLLKCQNVQKKSFRSRQTSETSETNEQYPEASATNGEAVTSFIADTKITTCKLIFILRIIKIFVDLFYFISVFILMTSRKATETLINRVSNYPDLLPEMPRYCCPVEI